MSLGFFIIIFVMILTALWWLTSGRCADGKSADEGVQSHQPPKQIPKYQKRTSELGIQFDEHGNPDMQSCFDVAFRQVTKDLTGVTDEQLGTLYTNLNEHKDDTVPKQAKAVIDALGSSNWQWVPHTVVAYSPSEYKEMAEAVANMVIKSMYQLRRYEQLMQMTEFNPYWQFKRPSFEDSSEHCKVYDGVVKHYKDPFWQTIKLPCSPSCSCHIYSRSERELARKGIVVGV